MEVKTFGTIEKANILQDGEVEVIVNSGGIDSYGEKIDINGVDFKDYMKNPVVLFGHDGFNLPIAKTTKLWVEKNKLMARAQFYMNDEFPKKVYNYIKDGFLKAVSIGGTVEDWGNDGITIKRMVMKEWSVVPIGADPKALVVNKAMITDLEKSARIYARKILTDKPDDLVKDIEVLEKLVASLKGVAQLGETEQARADNVRVVLRSAQAVDHQAERIIKVVKKGL